MLAEPVSIAHRAKGARIAAAVKPHRARLPLEIYPISAGLKGGLAGSVAMASAAILYGVISHGSVWYPINLLGAIVYAETDFSTAQISAIPYRDFPRRHVLHLTASILVGLLYGALLPMLPRRPVLLGGVFAPLVWTGVLYSVLDVIDPLLNSASTGLVSASASRFWCRGRTRGGAAGARADLAVSAGGSGWHGDSRHDGGGRQSASARMRCAANRSILRSPSA